MPNPAFYSDWQETVMTDAHKRVGKHMQQESSNKLLSTDCHLLALITVTAVSVGKCNQTIVYIHDAMVADGNPMGITAEIVKYFCRTIKRGFGIDHPVLFPELVDQL